MSFDTTTSLLAGMSDADLRSNLSALQAAMLALAAGSKPQVVELTGGGQHRAVTYAKTDISALSYMIRLVQAQLGIVTSPRFSARVYFH